MADYIEQAKELADEFDRVKKTAKDGLKKADNNRTEGLMMARTTDYTDELAKTIRCSLESLESIYDGWCLTQKNTHGLTFRVEDYIKKLKPRKIQEVEAAFQRLVEEGRSAIIAVSKSKTVEDDEEPQKRFCQCLVDLRYIKTNMSWLLSESNLQKTAMGKQVEGIEARYQEEVVRIRKAEASDSKEIQKRIDELNKQINEEAEMVERSRISNEVKNTIPDHYRFLIGFEQNNWQEKITSGDKKRIDGYFKNPNLWAGNKPVYFDPESGKGVLVIHAPKDFFDPYDGKKEFRKLLNDIYFSISSVLPANELQLGGIDSTAETILRTLGENIGRKLGEKALYNKSIVNKDSNNGYLKGLADYYREISTSMGFYDNIFEYNKNTPLSRKPCILNVFNYIPDCLKFDREDNISNFGTALLRGPKKGIFSIVCVNKKDGSSEAMEQIKKNDDLARVKYDVIDVDAAGNMTYNGNPFTNNIRTKDFSEERFLNRLQEREKEASVLPLTLVISQTEKEIENGNGLGRFTEEISIPMGMIAGTTYRFPLKVCSDCSFMLLLGSTNSGKSSLLHLMILSMAYFYSPDELELYLIDCKANLESPEFSKYKKENHDLYVPHVKYLALNNKIENMKDLLTLISNIHNERSAKFVKHNVTDMREYNNLDDVKKGKLEKMPFSLFVIDEYNQMFAQNEYIIKTGLVKQIANVVSTVRSSGIGIIFSGQNNSNALDSDTIAQIGCRMCLNVDEAAFTEAFPGLRTERDKYLNQLSRKGTVLIASNKGLDKNITPVSTAFVGNGENARKLAEKIREKYKNYKEAIQIVANQEGYYPLATGLKCPSIIDDTNQGGSFYLPIGVSSSTLLRVPLKFGTEMIASNYTALASASKLFMLERITSVMFLHKFRKKGELVYFSYMSEQNEFLKGFHGKRSCVEDKIRYCVTDLTILEQIMKVYDEFCQRREKAKQTKEDFSPMLLILHNVEWRKQDKLVRSVDKPKKEKKTERLSGEDISKMTSILKDVGLGDDVSAISGIDTDSVNEKKEQGEKSYSPKAVFNNLKTLHKEGNQYRIFVLISCERMEDFKEIVGTDDSSLKDYTIYGSFAESEGERRQDDNSDDVSLFAKPFNSKIRPFDLFDEDSEEFWEEMK